jgi:hypothetical protein
MGLEIKLKGLALSMCLQKLVNMSPLMNKSVNSSDIYSLKHTWLDL